MNKKRPVPVGFGFVLVIASVVTFALVGCVNEKDRVYGVIELVEKANADEGAWKGKEVSVSGYVSYFSHPEGPDGYTLDLIADSRSEIERHVICRVSRGDLADEIRTKTVVVKGKIGEIYKQGYLDLKRVGLDSCEIQK